VPRRFHGHMKLADRVAQFRAPFMVRDESVGSTIRLNNAADCAADVSRSPIRYVLSDELTRLCTALAYSEGARTLACADLLRVPSESLWVEWCCQPWQRELARHGLENGGGVGAGHRRGALFRASADGRRGVMRTFWSGDAEGDVLASCVEAYFDFDTRPGEDPDPPEGEMPSRSRVTDGNEGDDDVLERCFRFRYERSWETYYAGAALTAAGRNALWQHSLGTIAIDIPVLLAFFLLLSTRSGLPQRPQSFERLNRSRLRAGKCALLDHVDVSAPLFAAYRSDDAQGEGTGRRGPRLHHVRGHLVRRGSQLFWRVPHLRGSARHGAVLSRTVTLSFEERAPRSH
jgi:hypothetical protein